MLFLYQVENVKLRMCVFSLVKCICAGKCTLVMLAFFSRKPLLTVHVVVNKAARWKAEGKKINMTKSKYGRYLNN